MKDGASLTEGARTKASSFAAVMHGDYNEANATSTVEGQHHCYGLSCLQALIKTGHCCLVTSLLTVIVMSQRPPFLGSHGGKVLPLAMFLAPL